MVSNKHLMWVRKFKWASAGVALALFVAISFVHAPTVRADNQRVITVYHDGIEQTVVTDAATVGDALQRAGVTLNKYDNVEPAPNTVLVAPSYSVNVYRARPVTVIDGTARYTIMTSHTSAREIVKAAGLQLYDGDTYDLTRIDDFVNDGGVGLKLTIQRATPIVLVLYGKEANIRTQAKTVGDVLKEKNIHLAPQDGTNLPADTPVVAGLRLQVWRNGVQTVTNEEDIPFSIKQVRDTDQPVGYKQVQQPGVLGKKMVTYEITMQDGKETGRKMIQSVVTQDPKEQVEAIGARAPMGNISTEKANYMSAAGIAQADWGAVDYVISHESHWNVSSVNSSGCKGLGQACPGSKLVTACPNWDIDPVCQLNFFSGYAQRYGGWQGAYQFWLNHHWW